MYERPTGSDERPTGSDETHRTTCLAFLTTLSRCEMMPFTRCTAAGWRWLAAWRSADIVSKFRTKSRRPVARSGHAAKASRAVRRRRRTVITRRFSGEVSVFMTAFAGRILLSPVGCSRSACCFPFCTKEHREIRDWFQEHWLSHQSVDELCVCFQMIGKVERIPVPSTCNDSL